jgi:hypothetical protein
MARRVLCPCAPADRRTTRRNLIALRVTLGAETPAGHRCSNLVEQLENMREATGDQRAHLAKSIQKQMAELTALAPRSDKPQ